MKWFVQSLAALIVVIALAVPFMDGVQSDNTKKSAESESNTAVKVVSRRLPAIDQPLSSRTQHVPDFADIYDINERKREFFSYLIPAIEEVNTRVTAQRATLVRLYEKSQQGQALSAEENRWLNQLAAYYRVDEDESSESLEILLRRVDIVPATLVLIQAANESGWGTSRFAREGLNFFGQWCWTEGCGIVPSARPAGQVYEVRQFASMEASVEAFIRNLNTHFAYRELRTMRLAEREERNSVSSSTVTAGLMSYSERGQDYIDELNQMIRINRPIIEEVRDAFAG